jgi:integrase
MPKRTPSYCHHKASAQAVVRIDGKDHYLGKWNSPESKAEYNRLIGEWFANGQCLPGKSAPCSDLSVNELATAYWRHAEAHYRHGDGTPTDELHCIRAALRPLKELYGHTAVRDFGPLALKAVRQKMVESVDPRTGRPWCRRSINLHTYRVRAVFRWGVENELVPASVLHGLQAVRGLQKGRSEARETGPVKPLPEALVEATLPHVNPVVRAMIRMQLLTGMRPGEVVIMRAIDLDIRGAIWQYRPGSDTGGGRHKTAHLAHSRVIAIGPRAQEVLKPFLRTDLHAYLFCPAEALDDPKWRVARKAGERYTVGSYRQAVARGCARAVPPGWHPPLAVGIPTWHPHQLRHTKATEIRREAGLDAARAVLGHRSPAVTEVYAEIDANKAAEVAAKLG